jgi:hypothetical protein
MDVAINGGRNMDNYRLTDETGSKDVTPIDPESKPGEFEPVPLYLPLEYPISRRPDSRPSDSSSVVEIDLL